MAAGSDAVPSAAFLSTVPPERSEWRFAAALVALLGVGFVCAAPFARLPIGQVAAFMPAYEAALVINDLITAVLLIGQFNRLRSWALLILGGGYLFDALMTVPHALSFPGLFAPAGLLGAGEQTTVWLYVFWHGGFPVFVLAYALLRRHGAAMDRFNGRTLPAIAAVIAGVVLLVIVFALLAFPLQEWLPRVIRGNDHMMLLTKGVSPAVWLLSLAAFVLLWQERRRSVLDLWLMVVMAAWLADVGLAIVAGSARFDLGFYLSRTYGLMAATIVLLTLLLQISRLYGGLSEALATAKSRAAELEHLSLERARLASIVENSSDFIGVSDTNFRALYVNRAGQRLVGIDSADQVPSTQVAQYFDPGDLPRLADEVFPAVLARGRWAGELTFRHFKTGAAIPVLYDVFRVNDPGTGEPAFFATITRDLTERKRSEEAMRQAQKMEAVGQLTGGVAHDFNNLLTGIIGNLELLGARLSEERSRRLAESAMRSAERGARLVEQLLAFSRRQRLAPAPLDLNALVLGMSGLLRSTLGGTIRVETVLKPDLWPALADPTQLELVILNLAINARDAMPTGGAIAIETTNVARGASLRPEEPPPGDYAAVTVSDTGTGIPPAVMARAFEPFFTTKGPGKGSGLGLPQVLGVAQQLGGGVVIRTAPGEGTSVTIYLPRTAAAAKLDRDVHRPPPSVGPTLDGLQVLLVDDDSEVRAVGAEMLEALGCRVAQVGSGSAALDALAGGAADFDVVLMDFAMPGMNGVETERRAAALHPGLPIIFITGYADAGALAPGVAAERILQKPFRAGDLADKLAPYLRDSSVARRRIVPLHPRPA